jgi:hypothetical protein
VQICCHDAEIKAVYFHRCQSISDVHIKLLSIKIISCEIDHFDLDYGDNIIMVPGMITLSESLQINLVLLLHLGKGIVGRRQGPLLRSPLYLIIQSILMTGRSN